MEDEHKKPLVYISKAREARMSEGLVFKDKDKEDKDLFIGPNLLWDILQNREQYFSF